jgi:hypothetical protein
LLLLVVVAADVAYLRDLTTGTVVGISSQKSFAAFTFVDK